jgi:hypothetical protein
VCDFIDSQGSLVLSLWCCDLVSNRLLKLVVIGFR